MPAGARGLRHARTRKNRNYHWRLKYVAGKLVRTLLMHADGARPLINKRKNTARAGRCVRNKVAKATTHTLHALYYHVSVRPERFGSRRLGDLVERL